MPSPRHGSPALLDSGATFLIYLAAALVAIPICAWMAVRHGRLPRA